MPMSGASEVTISSFMMKYCQKAQPSPPYSCGQCAASQPLAPTFRVKSLASSIYSSDSLSSTKVSFQPCGSSAFKKLWISWRNSSSSRDQLKSMTVLLASTCARGHLVQYAVNTQRVPHAANTRGEPGSTPPNWVLRTANGPRPYGG